MSFTNSDFLSEAVTRHLSLLAAKVDEVAQRAGLSIVQRSDLTTTLAALPWRERRRLGLLLESTRISTTDEAVLRATQVMLGLAAHIWATTSPPGEATDSDRGDVQKRVEATGHID